MFGCNPISNTIVLEDIIYYFVGTGYPRGFLQLGIYLFLDRAMGPHRPGLLGKTHPRKPMGGPGLRAI
jgi:hypothetical protein